MKVLVFLSCVFMFANGLDKELADEMMEKIHEFGMECVEQEKPPQADLEALMDKQPPSSHEGKCTVFCMLKKFNIMKDATTVGAGYTPWLEKAQKNDPDFYNKLTQINKLCEPKVKLHGDDGCENAAEFMNCSKEESIKLGVDKAMGMT